MLESRVQHLSCGSESERRKRHFKTIFASFCKWLGALTKCLRDIDSVITFPGYNVHSTTTAAEMGLNAHQGLQQLSTPSGKLRKFRGRRAGCAPNKWRFAASWFIATWHALGRLHWRCRTVYHHECLHGFYKKGQSTNLKRMGHVQKISLASEK